MNDDVLVIVGVGGMGVSIARRCGAGRTMVLADAISTGTTDLAKARAERS